MCIFVWEWRGRGQNKKKNIKITACMLKILTLLDFWLTLVLLNPDIPSFANSKDPDQLASEEANWSGSALFAIQYMNVCQQSGSSYLTGWKLEVDVAS